MADFESVRIHELIFPYQEESPSSRSTANAMLFAVVGILLVCLGSQVDL